jgi:hypothetical protein
MWLSLSVPDRPSRFTNRSFTTSTDDLKKMRCFWMLSFAASALFVSLFEFLLRITQWMSKQTNQPQEDDLC